jgi:G3E family GTPase
LDKRKDLDYILIECSGMANPGPVATIFWLDDALDSRLRLDGIVTLCDARHIQEQFESTEEAAQQVAYADRILLNKIDLIEDKNDCTNMNDNTRCATSTLDGIVQSIRRFHPTAPIRQTTFAACELDWILDAKCFDADRIQAVEESFDNANSNAARAIPLPEISDGHDQHKHDHDHGHDHSHANNALREDGSCAICDFATATSAATATFTDSAAHGHTKTISTISLFLQGTVDLQKMDRWLASILWPNQDERDNVLRELLDIGGGGGGDGDEDQRTVSAKPSKHAKDHVRESKDTMSIFRIKGILSVRIDSDSAAFSEDHVDPITGLDKRRYIVQGVHDLWEIHPTTGKDLEWHDNDGEEDDRACRLVVIGRYLDEEALRNGFYSCSVGGGSRTTGQLT